MSSQTPTQSAAKKSLLHRLSLSGNSELPAGLEQQRKQPRSASGSLPATRIAGPAYESLPPGAAPSALRSPKMSPSHNGHASRSSPEDTLSLATPIAASFAQKRVSIQPPTSAQALPIRSPAPRNPIHPALASPPRSSTSQSLARTSIDLGKRAEVSRPGIASLGSCDQLNASVRSEDHGPTSVEIVASSRLKSDTLVNDATPFDPPRAATAAHHRKVQSPKAYSTVPTALTNGHRSASAGPTADRMQPQPSHGPPRMSEASAYALSVAPALLSRQPQKPSNSGISPAKPEQGERKVSRPLPVPPSASEKGGTTVHIISSTVSQPRLLGEKSRPRISIPEHESTVPTVNALKIDVPRAATSPSLVDPRTIGRRDPIDRPDKALSPAQLPRRTSSTAPKANPPTSPFASPSFASPDHFSSPPGRSRVGALRRIRRSGEAPIISALSNTAVQAALLAYLPVNSVLSLTGSSEALRRHFTGETVGRWVLKEWGVHVDKERGRSWPNLTVWEGFLESLLHDPSTYSTYPAQWHNLLQHLCLSYTLIVLHLRKFPPSAFPNSTLLPFEDDYNGPQLRPSASQSSLASFQRPQSRIGSVTGSDMGKMPKKERLIEISMPEPLAAKPVEELQSSQEVKVRRRGSFSSIASAASLAFGRKRSNSTSTTLASTVVAAPVVVNKGSLPPVSYPTAKRYAFGRPGESSTRSRTSSESGRPGSVFSLQSSPSIAHGRRFSAATSGRASQYAVPPMPTLPSGLMLPPSLNSDIRNGASSSSRRSEYGGVSPVQTRVGSPAFSRTGGRVEPAFDQPIPYSSGRAPLLRVFVPLSEKVRRWPSAEGALATVRELDKCGATRRLQLGDLIVNTAIRQPKSTEHVLLFVPLIKHLLVPLEYTHSPLGHLPSYIDAFALPPSYYYPFLPEPQIIFLNLAPYVDQALRSLRLAYDRRDVTTASGARINAKRYLHVAGFEVGSENNAASEWRGLVSLETEGTAEGKAEMEQRLGWGDPRRAVMAGWELVREKSIGGTVWLRLVNEIKRA